jgi:hypothetical protein
MWLGYSLASLCIAQGVVLGMCLVAQALFRSAFRAA